jgi:hypothetical protein
LPNLISINRDDGCLTDAVGEIRPPKGKPRDYLTLCGQCPKS